MQKGDVLALSVTMVKDAETKEDLCQIRVGKYTVLRLSMDETLALIESMNRVRELYLEQLRRKVANAKVGRSYMPTIGK